MSLFSLLAEIVFVGHSLIGPNLPPMVEGAMRAMGQPAVVEAQVINGAPLKYNWENSAISGTLDARAHLAEGRTDILVLTEAIPLAGQIEWNDTAGQVAAFAGLARDARPEAQVFVYETWHSLASGPGAVVPDDPLGGTPWRERIDSDLALWQGVVDRANAKLGGGSTVRLIPAGQAMGLAADAMARGEIPGLGGIRDLFSDDIHPNGKGFYLVAMTQVAAITGRSPEGLPEKLTRVWQSRDAVLTPAQAKALQRIAWTAVEAQFAREAAMPVILPPDQSNASDPSGTEPAGDQAAPSDDPLPTALTTTANEVRNPNLGLGLAGVHDWAVQQPFLDVMKTAREWTGHLPGQWGGWDHAKLRAGGWLNDQGWPIGVPPELTGIAALLLTEMPSDAGGLAGRYVMDWKGQGKVKLEGRINLVEDGERLRVFDYTPGPGGVAITIEETDAGDPIRDIRVVRQDRLTALDAGAIFNPDWLARIRGVRMIRFMDWMATNDSTLARLADRPKPDDYTWARNGVPVEVMVALANELRADPWFTLPHLAEDEFARHYATVVSETLAPGLRAYVELSNEVWNWQFAQAEWAERQGQAFWGREAAWVQFYALRAAEVMAIWSEVFGDPGRDRLVRVVGTQTSIEGMDRTILTAPLVTQEGMPAPHQSFDALAVTGYVAALLGSEGKAALVKGWLAESRSAAEAEALAKGLTGEAAAEHVDRHRFDLAVGLAAQELRDGSLSGSQEDTLAALSGRVWPMHAAVAAEFGLDLVMYEGGTHVVGYGAAVDDAELGAFFQHLNYSPEMGALYRDLLAEWARISPTPFNAFVDVYTPGKWGSWGALRHLTDDNPRWRALAEGCPAC
jgi:hypothetical protein